MQRLHPDVRELRVNLAPSSQIAGSWEAVLDQVVMSSHFTPTIQALSLQEPCRAVHPLGETSQGMQPRKVYHRYLRQNETCKIVGQQMKSKAERNRM